jgi:hypothetical protein
MKFYICKLFLGQRGLLRCLQQSSIIHPGATALPLPYRGGGGVADFPVSTSQDLQPANQNGEA